jgi:hypothetical protein
MKLAPLRKDCVIVRFGLRNAARQKTITREKLCSNIVHNDEATFCASPTANPEIISNVLGPVG